MRRIVTLLAILLFTSSLFSQDFDRESGLPFIQNYTAKDYRAHEQNWSIAQDDHGIMYFGNSNGLLEYDGVYWRFIQTQTPDIVRSVCTDGDGNVYIGGHDYFGYLDTDSIGNHVYVSLSDRLDPDERNFRDVWKTFSTAQGIIFQSKPALFLYAGDSLKVWKPQTQFHMSFMVNGEYYIRQYDVGLMMMKDGELELIQGGDFYGDKRIYVLFPYANGQLLIVTRDHGLFLYDGEKSSSYSPEAAAYLNKNDVFTATMTPDGNFVFATRNGGALVMDKKGDILQIVDKDKGLNNNKVWSVFYDKQDGLWMALDNGIGRIQYPSPLTYYGEDSGLPGGIEYIVRHDGRLHIGTHEGLFSSVKSSGSSRDFKFKRSFNLRSHVGQLVSYKDGLYFSDNDKGTYEIKKDRIRLISNLLPYSILASNIHKDVLFFGLPDGVAFLKKNNNDWVNLGRLNLDLGPIRYLAETSKGVLWLGTSKDVICRLNFTITAEDGSGFLTPRIEIYDTDDGLPKSEQYWVFTYGNEPHFGTYNGLYHFDEERQLFTRDTLMCNPLGNQRRAVQRLVEGEKGDAWMWTVIDQRNELGLLQKDAAGRASWNYRPFLPLQSSAFYAIYPDPELPGIAWFGGPDGLVKYDANIRKNYTNSYSAMVRKITANEDSIIFAGNRFEDQRTAAGFKKTIIDYAYNSLRFEYAAPSFDNERANRFQYMLEGYDEKWSQWTEETRILYRNIPEGNYLLRIRAINIYDVLSEEALYAFEILPPWYRSWFAYLIYGILVIGGIFTLVKIRSYQLEKEKEELERIVHERTDEIQAKNIQLAEQAEKLKEMDEVKSRFFANISHEFRTPLTLIIGPSEEGMKDDFKGDTRKAFATIKRNANRLLNLINQLLDLSRLESKKMELKASSQSISKFLKTIVANFDSLAETRNIHLQYLEPEKDFDVYFDRDKLEIVILNLMSNAFKFTPENGFIIVSIYHISDSSKYPNGAIEISVHDTGAGIEAAHLPYVFDRFSQGDNSQAPRFEGSGIGLALCKELVELHHGEIKVTSNPGEGTELDIILPLGKNHLRPEEIVSSSGKNYRAKERFELEFSDGLLDIEHDVPENDVDEDSDKSLVLIVEDNKEVRDYIKNHFVDDYRVMEANNGKAGRDLAMEHIPDLVISDVMMPEMDGMQLTDLLKTDEKTSHIPIIMLTAKATDADKIEGLETGADGYVTKPFNVTELEVRVKKLIESRQKLRQKFKKDFLTEPLDIRINTLDDQFIKTVHDLIEERMSDPDFSVDELQQHFPMSQRQFFLKIKALTDHTPGHFIRTMRLKRAMDLIKQNGGTISEIAYAVGFNNLSYFAKCFRTTFGKLPSEV